MSFKVNKSPEGGTCSVSPNSGVTKEIKFEILCLDWEDPEDAGISLYEVFGRLTSYSIETTIHISKTITPLLYLSSY